MFRKPIKRELSRRETYRKKSNSLRNANITDFLIIIVITNILIFSGILLFFYYKEGTPVPLELMNLFYAFFGTELLAMAGIQISKQYNERIKEQTEIEANYKSKEEDYD